MLGEGGERAILLDIEEDNRMGEGYRRVC